MNSATRSHSIRSNLGKAFMGFLPLLLGMLVLPVMGADSAAASTALSQRAEAKQYLTLAAPLNAAASKFVKQVDGWTNTITNARAETEAKPVIAAALTFDSGLKSDSWPKAARSDVKALRGADAPLVADLRALSSDNLHSPAGPLAKFERDENALGAAASAVRSDLGLDSTSATAPTNPAIASVMRGTADPKIPAMVPGKVAVLETSPPYSANGDTAVAVMVGNGTSGTVSHIVVAAPAVDATGKTVASGAGLGFTPENVAPGQVSFAFVDFGTTVPAGAKIVVTVTSYTTGVSPVDFDFQVTQAKSTPTQILGSMTNTSTTAISPEGGNGFCFDAKGALIGANTGVVGTKSLAPGAVQTFSLALIEPHCPTFLVGVWGIASSLTS